MSHKLRVDEIEKLKSRIIDRQNDPNPKRRLEEYFMNSFQKEEDRRWTKYVRKIQQVERDHKQGREAISKDLFR